MQCHATACLLGHVLLFLLLLNDAAAAAAGLLCCAPTPPSRYRQIFLYIDSTSPPNIASRSNSSSHRQRFSIHSTRSLLNSYRHKSFRSLSSSIRLASSHLSLTHPPTTHLRYPLILFALPGPALITISPPYWRNTSLAHTLSPPSTRCSPADRARPLSDSSKGRAFLQIAFIIISRQTGFW